MSDEGKPEGTAGIPAVDTLQRSLGLERDSAEAWDADYEISRRFLASWVGFVALGLPVLMLAAGFGECFRDSISHYYYGGVAGTLFTGLLFFIGSFLLAYRSVKWVTWLATVAGVFAFGVALFPTEGTGCEDGTFTGRPFLELTTDADGRVTDAEAAAFSMAGQAHTAHFISAALLFLILAFFCFFVFTRVLPKHRLPNGGLKPEKALRNRIYVICGIVMLVAMVAIAAKIWFGDGWSFWTALNLTFGFETFALWAFGVSWALKGRLGPFSDTAVGKLLIDPDDRRAPGKPPFGLGPGAS